MFAPTVANGGSIGLPCTTHSFLGQIVQVSSKISPCVCIFYLIVVQLKLMGEEGCFVAVFAIIYKEFNLIDTSWCPLQDRMKYDRENSQ